ncbi:UNVERIFIED_CONTAM: hypothetical protein Sradi_5744100 [Sesamum radiatum]|uniref:Uncharacterized protein n=1 Tax=Sesamum radiatum TaxID=300843 RepID=A0AAW2L622_SESRA
MSISSSYGAGGSVRGYARVQVKVVGCDGPTVKELAHISFIMAIMSTIIVSSGPMRSSMAGFGCGGVSVGGDGDV